MTLFSNDINLSVADISVTEVGKVDGESVVYPVLADNYRKFFESKYTSEQVTAIQIVEDLDDNSFYWLVIYDSREPLCENPICFTDGYGTAFALSNEEKKLLHNLYCNSDRSGIIA